MEQRNRTNVLMGKLFFWYTNMATQVNMHEINEKA